MKVDFREATPISHSLAATPVNDEPEDIDDELDYDDRACLRCGSVLPIEDEGLCPTCGTEYGRATIAMMALPKPLLSAAKERRDSRKAAIAESIGPAPVAEKSRGPLIALLVLLVLLAVATAVVAVVVLRP